VPCSTASQKTLHSHEEIIGLLKLVLNACIRKEIPCQVVGFKQHADAKSGIFHCGISAAS
jgi:hypothetical protein